MCRTRQQTLESEPFSTGPKAASGPEPQTALRRAAETSMPAKLPDSQAEAAQKRAASQARSRPKTLELDQASTCHILDHAHCQ